MRICRVSLLVVSVLGVTIGRQAHGGQGGRGNAAADIPTLPYNRRTGTGGISGLAITKDQRIWTGGVLRDLEGKVLGKLPAEVGGAGGAHGIAVTASGDVYVGQLSGKAQKFVKQ